MTIPDRLSFAVLAAGVAALFAAGVRSRDFKAGVAMLVELWTAAALLRLSFDRAFHNIVFAAATLLFRVLALRALRTPGARPFG